MLLFEIRLASGIELIFLESVLRIQERIKSSELAPLNFYLLRRASATLNTSSMCLTGRKLTFFRR